MDVVNVLHNAVDRVTSEPPQLSSDAISAFHELYYRSRPWTWGNTYWMGVPVAKCPLDLWIYQEILYRVRPNLILETGTWRGGSALFLASMCSLLGKGKVITVDISKRDDWRGHDRIRYLVGSSTSEDVLTEMRGAVSEADSVLVILDSGHDRDHVLSELRAYSPFVTKNSYLIVEDTNVNGHPVEPSHGPGPAEAVADFLQETGDFEVDSSCEKFLLTFNPRGFLKRKA